MTLKLSLTAVILGLTLAAPVAAQETGTGEAPAAELPGDLSMGEAPTAEGAAPDGIGSTYLAATHGSWEQRCVRTEDGADPCQLYQLLKDGEGNSVAEINLFSLPPGSEAAAGATAIVPLGTLLTEGLLLAVDTAEPKRYPFSWCSDVGCIARLGFTAEEVEALRKGSAATLSIVPVMAPDQRVTLNISLSGFTAGLKAVDEANAKAPPPAEGAAPAEGGN